MTREAPHDGVRRFAALTEVKRFVPFHHDPGHTDAELDRLVPQAIEAAKPACRVLPGMEGTTFLL